MNVTMERPDPNGPTIPGFSPMGRIPQPTTLEMIHLKDGWKVVPSGKDMEHKPDDSVIVEVSGVVVTQWSRSSGNSRIEAGAVVAAPMTRLQETLFDLPDWPRFWPRLIEARWLGPADTDGRRPAYLKFDIPTGPVECEVLVRFSPSRPDWQRFDVSWLPRNPLASNGLVYSGNIHATITSNDRSILQWEFSANDEFLASPDYVAQTFQAIVKK